MESHSYLTPLSNEIPVCGLFWHRCHHPFSHEHSISAIPNIFFRPRPDIPSLAQHACLIQPGRAHPHSATLALPTFVHVHARLHGMCLETH